MPLTLEQKNKRKLSQVKNEIVKSAVGLEGNGIDIPIFHQCREALLNNIPTLNVAWEDRGNDYTDTYNQYGMLESCLSYQYDLISQFIKTPSQETYNKLLNAYFLKVIYFIAQKNYKESLNNGFDTDRTLSLFFAMMYCDHYIQSEMMDVLAYYKNHEEFNRDEDGIGSFFGEKTILPLAYHFYTQVQQNKTWSFDLSNVEDNKGKPVCAHIMANITPLYQKIIDNIETDDMALLQELIDELCQYRLDHSKGNYLLEFNGNMAEYFPIEILFLLKHRVEKGHSIDGIHHILIDDFLPYFLKDFIVSDDNKVFGERALSGRYMNE
ncbi:hypothetical protein A4G20_08020 [Pasteurellaceae bacterium RH1A]|nr:hypothetical protein A4G20_08020 [Pasteurellaceae bacterium RH1A]